MPYIGPTVSLVASRVDMLISPDACESAVFALKRINFSKQSEKDRARAALDDLAGRVANPKTLFLPGRFPPDVAYIQWSNKVIQMLVGRLYAYLSYDEAKTVRQAEKNPNTKVSNDAEVITINSSADASRGYYTTCDSLERALNDLSLAWTSQQQWEATFNIKWVEKDFSAVVLTDTTFSGAEVAKTQLFEATKTYNAIAKPTQAQTDAYLQEFAKQSAHLFHPVDNVPAPTSWNTLQLAGSNAFVDRLRAICRAVVKHSDTISEVMQFVGQVAGIAATALLAPAPSAGQAGPSGDLKDTSSSEPQISRLTALLESQTATLHALQQRLAEVERSSIITTD